MATCKHPEILGIYYTEDIDLFAFIHATDPTKVRVVEREGDEGDPRVLETTVGRTVPLLPISPDRTEKDRQDANIQPVVEAADTILKDATPVQLRRQEKRKYVVVDAGEASHPLKKLREDHGTLSGASVGASASTTSEHKDEDYTDSVAESNLHTIEAPRRSSAPIMTTVTITTPTVDPTSVTKEKVVEPYLFGVGSFFAGGTDPCVFLYLTSSDFLVGAIRTVINPDTDL
nr:hypothetical protein [Tanacetum cinerariifolium]